MKEAFNKALRVSIAVVCLIVLYDIIIEQLELAYHPDRFKFNKFADEIRYRSKLNYVFHGLFSAIGFFFALLMSAFNLPKAALLALLLAAAIYF